MLMFWQKYCKCGSTACNLTSTETGTGWYFFIFSFGHFEKGLSFKVCKRTDFTEKHVHVIPKESQKSRTLLKQPLLTWMEHASIELCRALWEISTYTPLHKCKLTRVQGHGLVHSSGGTSCRKSGHYGQSPATELHQLFPQRQVRDRSCCCCWWHCCSLIVLCRVGQGWTGQLRLPSRCPPVPCLTGWLSEVLGGWHTRLLLNIQKCCARVWKKDKSRLVMKEHVECKRAWYNDSNSKNCSSGNHFCCWIVAMVNDIIMSFSLRTCLWVWERLDLT